MSVANRGGGLQVTCDETGCLEEAQSNTRDEEQSRANMALIGWTYNQGTDEDRCPGHS